MYLLIESKAVSKMELEEYYTLDEFLKLYALWQMQLDIEAIQADDLRRNSKK